MSALTEQTIEGHVSLDARSANVQKNRGTFALHVRGDSMIGAHILDGDDPLERQRLIGQGNLARGLCVRASAAMGTSPLTVRIHLDIR